MTQDFLPREYNSVIKLPRVIDKKDGEKEGKKRPGLRPLSGSLPFASSFVFYSLPRFLVSLMAPSLPGEESCETEHCAPATNPVTSLCSSVCKPHCYYFLFSRIRVTALGFIWGLTLEVIIAWRILYSRLMRQRG